MLAVLINIIRDRIALHVRLWHCLTACRHTMHIMQAYMFALINGCSVINRIVSKYGFSVEPLHACTINIAKLIYNVVQIFDDEIY